MPGTTASQIRSSVGQWQIPNGSDLATREAEPKMLIQRGEDSGR